MARRGLLRQLHKDNEKKTYNLLKVKKRVLSPPKKFPCKDDKSASFLFDPRHPAYREF
jgi:hypothetical protein